MFETALANAFWASVLAVLVLIVSRFCRRPGLIHGLWLVVFVKLFMPPLVQVQLPIHVDALTQLFGGITTEVEWNGEKPVVERDGGSGLVSWPSPNRSREKLDSALRYRSDIDVVVGSDRTSRSPATKHSSAQATGILHPHNPLPFANWKQLLRIVWLTGSVTFAAICFAQLFSFRRIARGAVVDDRFRRLARDVANKLGMKSVPAIRVVNSTMSPAVWCLLSRPCVYVPRKLLDELDQQQATTLLAHEFAHIKRGDHLVRWLELATLIFYWWLPTVWLARHQLRLSEEECCDAMVVQHFPTNTDSYISTLLQTVEFLVDSRARLPALASGMGSFHTQPFVAIHDSIMPLAFSSYVYPVPVRSKRVRSILVLSSWLSSLVTICVSDIWTT